MRIAVISETACIPTQDSRVFREACALVREGYEVLVIGMLTRQALYLPKSDEYNGVQIRRIAIESGWRIPTWLHILGYALAIFDLPMLKAIKRVFVRLASRMLDNVLNIVGIMRYFVSLWFSRSAYRILKDYKPDVIHGHDLPTMPLAVLCKRRWGCKVVYDNHELWLDRNTSAKPRWLWRGMESTLEHLLISKVDATLVVGDSINDIMRERYGVPVTTLYNYPMPRNGAWSLHERLDIPKHFKIALYLGLITPYRGVEDAIGVMKLLPDYVLVMMGYYLDPSYASRVYAYISHHGLGERVYFMPSVPFDQVTTWAASADVSIMLIEAKWRSYQLAFPNKLLESVAAGLPIVTNKASLDVAAFVAKHNIGKAVSIWKPQEIAEAVKEVQSDPRYRINSQVAAKSIDWNQEVKKLLAIYRRFA